VWTEDIFVEYGTIPINMFLKQNRIKNNTDKAWFWSHGQPINENSLLALLWIQCFSWSSSWSGYAACQRAFSLSGLTVLVILGAHHQDSVNWDCRKNIVKLRSRKHFATMRVRHWMISTTFILWCTE
jgi:hypothetical protein